MWRGTTRRLVLAGTVGTALLVLLSSAVAQADRKIDDRFDVRRTANTSPGIPGEPLNGSAEGSIQKRKGKLTMNGGGGGQSVTRSLTGTLSCNLPEQLAATLYFGDKLCGNIGHITVPLFDTSVFPRRYVPFVEPRYGLRGWAADELRTTDDVEAAVEESANRQMRDHPFLYSLDPIPARYEATRDLLSDPITSNAVRHKLIDNLISLSGATPTTGVTDPKGRPASMIEIPDTSRAGIVKITINGVDHYYDLRGAAELRLQLFYNPETYDILSDRVLLASTTVAELQDFAVSTAPDDPAIWTTTYTPVTHVHRPELASYRIPCHKVDDPDPKDTFCVHFGPLQENVGLK